MFIRRKANQKCQEQITSVVFTRMDLLASPFLIHSIPIGYTLHYEYLKCISASDFYQIRHLHWEKGEMLFYTKQTGFSSLSEASKTLWSCQMHFFSLSLLRRFSGFFQVSRITGDMHLSPSIRWGWLSTTAEQCRCIGSTTEREKTIEAASELQLQPERSWG